MHATKLEVGKTHPRSLLKVQTTNIPHSIAIWIDIFSLRFMESGPSRGILDSSSHPFAPIWFFSVYIAFYKDWLVFWLFLPSWVSQCWISIWQCLPHLQIQCPCSLFKTLPTQEISMHKLPLGLFPLKLPPGHRFPMTIYLYHGNKRIMGNRNRRSFVQS